MAHSSSDTAILTLEKSFVYRGNREHWANAYHLDQVPPDNSVWGALANLAWLQEKNFLTNVVQFERATGHLPGTPPVLVYEQDVAPPGEGGDQGTYIPATGFVRAPGDAAMWVRWGTTQKSVLGKPIYLRNYYHDVHVDGGGDTIDVGQHQALLALGQAWQTGYSVSGITYRRAGPRGAVAQNHGVSTYATTRTLKARGRRRHKLPAGTTVQFPPIKVAPGWEAPPLGIN